MDKLTNKFKRHSLAIKCLYCRLSKNLMQLFLGRQVLNFNFFLFLAAMLVLKNIGGVKENKTYLSFLPQK